MAGGPVLDALSVVPDLQGAPLSGVHYEIDEWAGVLEFDEEEPVGTVVGKLKPSIRTIPNSVGRAMI